MKIVPSRSRPPRFRRGVLIALIAAGLMASVSVDALALFTNAASVGSNPLATDTLEPPTSLTADAGTPGQVDLSWTATADGYAEGYNIYRSQTSGSGYALLDTVAGVNTVTYSDVADTGPMCTVIPGIVGSESTVNSENATSATVAVPGGAQADDLLIAHISIDGNNPGFATPPGWMLIGTNGSGSGSGHATYYRVVDGNEPSSHTFTWSDNKNPIATMLLYRGIDTGNPINGAATSDGDSSTPTAPSVTTTANGAVIVRLLSNDNDLTITGPTSHNVRYTLTTDGGGGDISAGAADTTQTVAGASGTANFSLSGSHKWTTATIALTPDLTTTGRCIPVFEEMETHLENLLTTSTVIGVPAGVAADDLLIAHIAHSEANVGSVTPTGWTLLDEANGGVDNSVAVFYRVADGTEPASYTFTWTTASNTVGSISRYSGVDPTAPIQRWAAQSGSSVTPTAPAVSIDSDATVLRFVGNDDDETIAVPTGYDTRYALETDGSGFDTSGALVDRYQATIGNTDTATFALPNTQSWRTHTIALQPLNPDEDQVGVVDTESTINTFDATSITVAIPTGTQVDDLLIAHISVAEKSPGFLTPAGWTLIATNTPGAGSGHAAYYRVADGTESSTATFTWSTSKKSLAAISQYRGIDPTTPIDTTATSEGDSDAPTAPSVTTTVTDSLIVRLLSNDDDRTITAPAGHKSRYTLDTGNVGGDVSAGAADVPQATAGATGTANFTLSAAEKWATTTIALRTLPTIETSSYYVVAAYAQNWTSGNSNEAFAGATESRVSASFDDAEEFLDFNDMYLNSTDLELTREDATDAQIVGLRFNSVEVPAGVTITGAWIQFQTDETSSEATNLTFRAHDVDDAPTFSSATSNISGRPTTTASVAWTPAAWTVVGAATADQQTPDLSSIVQEVVDRPGWADGNSIAIIISGTGQRIAESYDGQPSAAPLLHIEYSSP